MHPLFDVSTIRVVFIKNIYTKQLILQRKYYRLMLEIVMLQVVQITSCQLILI